MNPLHELADLFHEIGEKLKPVADKLDAAFRADAPKAEQAVEGAAKAVEATAEAASTQVGQEAVKAAETAAPVVEAAVEDAAKNV